MATQADLQNKLTSIKELLVGEDAFFTNLSGDLTNLKSQIQALSDQVAQGQVLTQDQLNDAVAQADDILANVGANAQKLSDLASSTPDA